MHTAAAAIGTRRFGRRAHRRLEPDQPGTDPAKVAVCILGVAAVSFLVAGFVYVWDSFAMSRETSVKRFETAVARWDAQRDALDAIEVSCQALVETRRGAMRGDPVPLPSVTVRDELLDRRRKDGELPEYKALRYESMLPLESLLDAPNYTAMVLEHAPDRRNHVYAVGPNITIEYTVSEVRAGGKRVDWKVPAGPYELERLHAQSPKRCVAQQGVLRYGRCWVVKRMQYLCVQIAEHPSGEGWLIHVRTENAPGSHGCDYAHGIWNPTRYETVSQAEATPRAVDLHVGLRFSDDPYFRALELTHGKLDFGMSTSSEWTAGLLLLSFGALLSIPLWCICVDKLKAKKKESAATKYFEPEEDVQSESTIGRHFDDFDDEEMATIAPAAA